MGRTIWKQRISNLDLMKRFAEKSADINKKFFKESCDKWAAKERLQMMSTQQLLACPCNLNMARNDGRFFNETTSSPSGKHNNIFCWRTTVEKVGDQQCCYGGTGELLSYAEGGGSTSRFSPTRQPLHYMLQDYWPKIVCDKLANNTSVYLQLRPTDDCSSYVPPKQGARVLCKVFP
ncbi:hypothetical protein NP493_458g00011 [Ridgeia piscesae]|uniref:AMOP domain-containing protein n=1 Tax=Ridgeia piscesae TaxID=27915 RepID=A0AAD9KYW1_RIDPI|nr:hypothetical protein NP493_458g00011 [Ridgeia piscesae]